ncbi:DegT/DnrJ/EryC1/StrS family aminotransferase [Nocardioides donggukensis]|uniref:DegT/DnrJ/EryC1/StrS family aminotransferase n=1 Tax=Nocardioides donggukensis TaxID=2774019 RepID=A0A927K7B1_9ACTN|nr:DegT/DnrJ/EryC1/StrS family aminotransferase [Nocardioides donggukensis]MBD8870485.1 DegT/DnrJ/EryC1/StrS family aminotransferase [Nocardioides donggukensis]
MTDPAQARGPIPLVDLGIQTREILAPAMAAIHEVLESGSFVLGPAVRRFEEEYAAFCDVDHCVGVANGTDAVELALRAAEVGRGDEVIVPANTFVATAEAVVRTGADLVLADCDDDGLIDVSRVADRLTNRTRAVVGVDLYGQVAPFDLLAEAVGDRVVLVEDAAQAQGATRHGRPAGSFGLAAGTSFYPGKNLGAAGDAGAVTTDDPVVADRVRALRNHGGVNRYEHRVVGGNSRLDSIQAVFLSLKLPHLKEWNEQRDRAAESYRTLLSSVPGVRTPRTAPGNTHVWHLYVVRVPDRDRVLAALNAAGIGAGIHYPMPVHLLPAFAHLGHGPGSFPVAERLAEEIMSLPLFPGITGGQVERVVDELRGMLAPDPGRDRT